MLEELQSSFQALEELHIYWDGVIINKLPKNYKMSLPNLKVLKIYNLILGSTNMINFITQLDSSRKGTEKLDVTFSGIIIENKTQIASILSNLDQLAHIEGLIRFELNGMKSKILKEEFLNCKLCGM